jgi:hypothetical protein
MDAGLAEADGGVGPPGDDPYRGRIAAFRHEDSVGTERIEYSGNGTVKHCRLQRDQSA